MVDSQNPYQAPTTEVRVTDTGMPAPERSLKWMLFSFEGRIPRRVYWGASIAMVLVFYALYFGLVLVFGDESLVAIIGLLVLYIPLVWMSLAVQVKRWHDRDKSGWWILIGFVPIIGGFWSFIEQGCLRGTFGENDYGPDPT